MSQQHPEKIPIGAMLEERKRGPFTETIILNLRLICSEKRRL
jgi:hypothetical protein